MKFFLIPIFTFLIVTNVLSQDSASTSSGNLNEKSKFDGNPGDQVFQKIEVEASFPGGASNWRKYLQSSLNASVPIDNNAPAGTYTVIVRFVVNKSGEIMDVKAETNHGFGMEAEAMRVIKNGPKWIAGSQNGKLVNSVRRQPLTFVVAENKVYKKGEKPAEFTGGILNWESFMKRNLDADVPTRKNAPKGGYDVIVKFLIKKDGSIEDVEAITNLGFGMEEEVIRVIKKSPNWIPAMKDGENVDSYQKQVIAFYVSKNPEKTKSIEELLKPDVEPEFPGTVVDWRNYLRNNLDEQVPYFNSAPMGRYKVVVEFIVDVDGAISEVKAKTKHGYGMEKEAIRVIKNSPKWIPGKLNGEPIKSRHYQPITFIVNEE